MINRLTSGMDEGDTAHFKESFDSCKRVRDVIVATLKKDIDKVYSEMSGIASYNVKHRTDFLADCFGQIKQLKNAIELLSDKAVRVNKLV